MLKPYSSARSEYKGSKGIFLDANENPFGKLNRYPDPFQHKLKARLSKGKAVSIENIFIGNGSDEIIDIAFRIFCNPTTDKVLVFSPTYGMYKVLAEINNVELINFPLTNVFQINTTELIAHLNNTSIKIIFICSPNNPTGNSLVDVQFILDNFKGIVFIDEAYIDFSNSPSWVTKIDLYKNLVVSQTLSKAWGLAAARIGIAYGSSDIINWFNKIKPPYNVSLLNQKAALKALKKQKLFSKRKEIILFEKEKLNDKLAGLSIVKKVYPSDANFLLVEFFNADDVYNALINKKIITRNRSTIIKNCIRITVGLPAENKKLIAILKTIA